MKFKALTVPWLRVEGILVFQLHTQWGNLTPLMMSEISQRQMLHTV